MGVVLEREEIVIRPEHHYTRFACFVRIGMSKGVPWCNNTAQNVLNFMQFFQKIWQNRMLAPLAG